MSSPSSAPLGSVARRLSSLPSETYLGLLGYVFIGTAAVLVPSVMSFITEEYTGAGISLASIALIFPARSVGAIVGNVFAGVGSDLVGAQRLVWLSALGLALSLFLTAASQQWLLFVTGFVLVSATQGALSTGINTMIADANRKARARALNTLHGVYGAGAAVSPSAHVGGPPQEAGTTLTRTVRPWSEPPRMTPRSGTTSAKSLPQASVM